LAGLLALDIAVLGIGAAYSYIRIGRSAYSAFQASKPKLDVCEMRQLVRGQIGFVDISPINLPATHYLKICNRKRRYIE
jgi:hypothetical protein